MSHALTKKIIVWGDILTRLQLEDSRVGGKKEVGEASTVWGDHKLCLLEKLDLIGGGELLHHDPTKTEGAQLSHQCVVVLEPTVGGLPTRNVQPAGAGTHVLVKNSVSQPFYEGARDVGRRATGRKRKKEVLLRLVKNVVFKRDDTHVGWAQLGKKILFRWVQTTGAKEVDPLILRKIILI